MIGAIAAWNAPTLIASWKLGPALAAGNAVVLKPAEDSPLTALHLATLIEEVGFPAGVVSVLPGHGETAGAALVRHPLIDKISFTGSPEVGREIAVEAAREFRRVTLELGGKSPQIVLADADLNAVLPGVAIGFLANQGEICAAGTRVLVARELYDDVVGGLADAARGVRLGDPFDETTTMGALINGKQRDRVTGYIEQGTAEGAELVTGGGRPDRPGFFVEPTVFAGTSNAIGIAQDEIFGPVALVLPFDDPEHAIGIANDTRYGLAAYRLDAEPVRGTPPRRAAARRRRLDQRPRRPRCATALGRAQDQRHRPRARLGRHRGKHRREDRHHHVLTGSAPAAVVTREEMDERG